MNFEHASRFASAQARRAAGDLYPDRWLVPVGQRRALDALLAVALGPAARGGEAFRAGFERSLRGRPDGPLLLALWGAASAAELAHADLRRLVEQAAQPLPDFPADRAALEAELAARVEPFVCCALAVLERSSTAAMEPALVFGRALAHTHLLLQAPALATAGRFPWPAATLRRAGLSPEQWRAGANGSEAAAWRAEVAGWAEQDWSEAAAVLPYLGARWRRALAIERGRALLLLRRYRDPCADPMRRPPRVSAAGRWSGRVRALGILARSVLLPHSA